MSALPPRNDRLPVFRAIAQWWRRWTGAKPAPIGFSGPDETRDNAQESGLSASQPLSISSQGLHGSNLLERRMVALNLDPAEVARSEPALFRSFQRLCTSCRSPMRCARDLAEEFARDPSQPASSDWRDYCPNATTLNMLSTLESCSLADRDRNRSSDIVFDRMIYLSGIRPK
ncbi:MAG TPA: hypothetical protein VFK79_12525 [Xanthobacteraceae bacterium]|nr:hypothetical protein [Xanthobacteraceae bacterium]